MKEHIRRFNISVDDIGLMQLIETLEQLVSNFPNTLLLDTHFSMQMFLYFPLHRSLHTLRSPSLAKSITTHKFSVYSS